MVGMEQARKELTRLVRDLKKDKVRYLLSARGKPQAVVLSVDDYLKNFLKQKRSKILTSIQLEAKEKRLDRLTTREIDAEVRAYRAEKRKR